MPELEPLTEAHLAEPFRTLERQEVRDALFGALALHGLPRATREVDLFLDPDTRNLERARAWARKQTAASKKPGSLRPGS